MKEINIFCFGFGQVAKNFIKKLDNEKYNINLSTTSRNKSSKEIFKNINYNSYSFNGENFDEWVSSSDLLHVEWILNPDKSMTVKNKAGDIQTKRDFGDMQLHIEWKSSEVIKGKGQSRSNSGVFIQDRYEVQVLDNNDNETYVNGQVGSIYKQGIPLAKASSKAGKWNVYDIIYHAPVFNEAGEKTESGRISILHNGVLIQDHYEIIGTTQFIGWPKNKPHGKAPIRLQDHRDNSGVSYRNIWVREL